MKKYTIDIKKIYADLQTIVEVCVDEDTGEINHIDANFLLLQSLKGTDLKEIKNLTDCDYEFDSVFLERVNFNFYQGILDKQLEQQSKKFCGFEAVVNKTQNLFQQSELISKAFELQQQ